MMKTTLKFTIAAALVLAFPGCGAAGAKSAGQQQDPASKAVYHKISPQEAKQMLDANPGAILLDVRTQAEYEGGHIHGATSFPLDQIDTKAATALPDKNALILVYCRSGVRSEAAANKLVSMGYTRVYDMGGINSWPYGTE